jgi:hypothetical protein
MPANEYKNLNGILLTLPSRPSFVSTLIGLGLPDQATTEIDNTDLSSSVKVSFAGPVLDCGELSVTIRFTPDIAVPIGQVDELIRVTMPLLTGQSTAGKYEFQGHISKMTAPKAANDGRSEVGLTMQVNTKPVWTAGA